MPLLLAEDAHRLYLYKPAGLTVFPPHADPSGDCLLARVLHARPDRAVGWPPGFEGGIAHRLDTATSGLVVAARTPADLAPLRAAFAAGVLRKFYLFRSDAAPPFSATLRTDPIAHHPNRRDRMVVRRGPRTPHRGKWYDAWTRFRALGGGWWEAEIRTGVMHQVRVHALAAGVPLAADPIYGPPPSEGEAAVRAPAAPGAAPRPILHHWRMLGPDWASPEAPLPDDAGAPDDLVRP